MRRRDEKVNRHRGAGIVTWGALTLLAVLVMGASALASDGGKLTIGVNAGQFRQFGEAIERFAQKVDYEVEVFVSDSNQQREDPCSVRHRHRA